jgi:hypothetical protein
MQQQSDTLTISCESHHLDTCEEQGLEEVRSADLDRGKASGLASVKRRRVPRIERTLAVLVQSMQGMTVIVELKNDAELTGVLDETDASMKCVLAPSAHCTSYILYVVSLSFPSPK